TARSGRGPPPATQTRPAEADSRPVTARISVVLPAPLGPSRPVTPGPKEHDSSDSATFGPKNIDRPDTTTVGSGTKAGSSAGSTGGAAAGGSGGVAVTVPPTGSARGARPPTGRGRGSRPP